MIAMTLVNAMMNPAAVPVFGVYISLQIFAVLATVPICLYSGKKLTHSKAAQWGFYLFYPLHLLALWIVLGFIR